MIKAGTKIVCPNQKCSSILFEVVYDLHPGMQLLASCFKGIAQPSISGEPMRCKKCGSAYFFGNSLHTELGWNPYDPFAEPIDIIG